MENELSEMAEDGGEMKMSKGARLRMEKKTKEAAEHKKRMLAMKSKAKTALGESKVAARPKFDR